MQATNPEASAEPTERKRPCFANWDEIERHADGLIALSGDEDGPIRRAWMQSGREAANETLRRLTEIFTGDRVYVELQKRLVRGEERELKFLRDIAAENHLPLLATGGVDYATEAAREVADVFTCLRNHTTVDAAGRLLAITFLPPMTNQQEFPALTPARSSAS